LSDEESRQENAVREFYASFGCDIVSIVRGKIAEVECNGESKKRRVEGTNGGGLNLKTPAAMRFAGRPPATRMVMKGEKVV
jgi:hypothetical protein